MGRCNSRQRWRCIGSVIQMANKSIDDWIELLADRSKAGNIGEYFHRRQCAELLEFLVELKWYRKLTDREVWERIK